MFLVTYSYFNLSTVNHVLPSGHLKEGLCIELLVSYGSLIVGIQAIGCIMCVVHLNIFLNFLCYGCFANYCLKKDQKQKKKLSAKKRERRIWSAEEETILIDLLYEMNSSGWKVDTGHKSGYLSYIEKEMAKKLPNSDLKADPHIKSKVKILKKQLSYILEIQQYGSGFGWDDELKMVTGDKETFMEWAKVKFSLYAISLFNALILIWLCIHCF